MCLLVAGNIGHIYFKKGCAPNIYRSHFVESAQYASCSITEINGWYTLLKGRTEPIRVCVLLHHFYTLLPVIATDFSYDNVKDDRQRDYLEILI